MNILWLEIRNTWKNLLSWTAALCIINFLMLAFFPSMQTESMKELAGAKLEGIDPTLLEALGLGEFVDFTVISNFFGYVLQYLTIAIMVFITQVAVTSLVKEETDGTIELLYSKPITRSQIFVQKGLANLLMFIVLLVALFITTVVGYLLFSDYSFGKSLQEAGIFYGAILYVGLIYLALGMLLSSLLKSSKSASGIVMAIVFGTYILGIMGTVVDSLSFLHYISPMEWIKAQKLMSEGFWFTEWVIGIFVIIAGSFVAHKTYQSRDLRL